MDGILLYLGQCTCVALYIMFPRNRGRLIAMLESYTVDEEKVKNFWLQTRC